MNLVFRYLSRGIEGYPLSELETIIRGNHKTKVRMATNGMLMLDNSKIIKCVKNYYNDLSGKPIALKKISNECYYIQQAIGIERLANNSCAGCHLQCISKHREGKLTRR